MNIWLFDTVISCVSERCLGISHFMNLCRDIFFFLEILCRLLSVSLFFSLTFFCSLTFGCVSVKIDTFRCCQLFNLLQMKFSSFISFTSHTFYPRSASNGPILNLKARQEKNKRQSWRQGEKRKNALGLRKIYLIKTYQIGKFLCVSSMLR